jgi:Flp pilus assembly pilin Flp
LPTLVRLTLRRLVREARGQDLIEYALLAGFVALMAAGSAEALGFRLSDWYSSMGGISEQFAGSDPAGNDADASASAGEPDAGGDGRGGRGRGGGRGGSNCSDTGIGASRGTCQ